MSAEASDLAALTEGPPDGIVDAHHHVWDLSVGHRHGLQATLANR